MSIVYVFEMDTSIFYLNKIVATDLIWTAPEHLRTAFPGQSQKGDVYSYAIILHEIVLQSGPFGNTELTPEGLRFTV